MVLKERVLASNVLLRQDTEQEEGGPLKKRRVNHGMVIFLRWGSVLKITWRTTIFLSHIWSEFGVAWTVQTVEF